VNIFQNKGGLMATKFDNVYIVAPKRTAIGSFQGALASVSATELGAHVVKATLSTANVDPMSIQEVVMGCVLTAGLGQAPARQVALKSGLPNHVQAMTINKVCSSGLKAVMLAAQYIELGVYDAVIAGGMESMSCAPYLISSLRTGARLGHVSAEDSIIKDGLWDVYNNFHMGNAAELCAKKFSLTREEQDNYAISSYTRANQAIQKGYFREEITPIQVRVGKDDVDFEVDEEPGKGKPEKVSQLKPVFDKNGTITAANASSLNDGAASMIICSEGYIKEHSLKPVARIISQGWFANEPEWFTTAPISAIRSALQASKLSIADIDLFEINEAFSAVALACARELEIDSNKLNIQGGAVALGHPIGASGARILTTLVYALARLSLKKGVVGICNGGGEATSIVVEMC
jgi:acetyl-CoA C-acetyltransferase